MMDSSLENRPVLVAVANPDHAEQLVRTASDLARSVDESVRIVSIVVKPHDSPFSVYSDETIIEHFSHDTQEVLEAAVAVAPTDVPIEREILVAPSVADGVLTAISQANARALVIGWQERRTRTDTVLGTNLDRLITYASCDLYVERIGYEANGVDSILVPVAGGPHVRPATFAAKAIAVRNSATVHVLSVAETENQVETERDDIATAVRLLEEAPGPSIPVETLLRTGDDVSDIITEIAPDHDVLIFGVTRQSAVHRRLVGSIPQTVIPQTDSTVLLARSAAVVRGSWIRRLGRFWKHS